MYVYRSTSCRFAINVARARAWVSVEDGDRYVTAHSPVTGAAYATHCVPTNPTVRTGGDNAAAHIYGTAG